MPLNSTVSDRPSGVGSVEESTNVSVQNAREESGSGVGCFLSKLSSLEDKEGEGLSPLLQLKCPGTASDSWSKEDAS